MVFIDTTIIGFYSEIYHRQKSTVSKVSTRCP